MSIKKVVRGDRVAVLVSPGYGAGWSTWVDDETEQSLFDPEIVAWVESGKPDIDLDEKFGHYGYIGGLRDVEIEWVPEGYRFIVDEYDGAESLTIINPDYGYVA